MPADGFFSWADLSIWFRGKMRNGFMVERPARGLKMKKPSGPGKTENEGIQRTRPKIVRQAGLILLFDGEVVEWLRVFG